MVDIGGEVVVRGKNSKMNAWRIGINNPVDDSLSVNQELQTVLAISDVGMATSGTVSYIHLQSRYLRINNKSWKTNSFQVNFVMNAHVVGYQVEVVSKRWHNLIYYRMASGWVNPTCVSFSRANASLRGAAMPGFAMLSNIWRRMLLDGSRNS